MADHSPVSAVIVGDVDGRPIAVAGRRDGVLQRWDVTTRVALGGPMTGHTQWIRALATARSGTNSIVVSGADDTIRPWDLTTGEQVGAPIDCRARLLAVSTVQGVLGVVSVSEANWVEVWDLETRERFVGPLSDWAAATAFLRRGDALLAVMEGDDGESVAVRVWDLLEGTPLGPPLVGGELGGTVMRTPLAIAELGGELVLVSGAGSDGAVRLWSVASGKLRATLDGHADEISCVATARLGDQVVAISGSKDGTLRRWDVASGTPLGDALRGHAGNVRTVAVAQVPGSAIIVSGGDDGTVRLWDVGTGAALAPLA